MDNIFFEFYGRGKGQVMACNCRGNSRGMIDSLSITFLYLLDYCLPSQTMKLYMY
jgi:hypothetical protein